MHIVGEEATELIHQGQVVLHFGGTVDYFIHATFDVPTLSDAYKYAAYDCLQRLAARPGDRGRRPTDQPPGQDLIQTRMWANADRTRFLLTGR